MQEYVTMNPKIAISQKSFLPRSLLGLSIVMGPWGKGERHGGLDEGEPVRAQQAALRR